MGVIIIKGWKDGLEKVSLTKLQMSILNLSLLISKSNTDKLLNGEIVKIDVSNSELGYRFVKKAGRIGAMCDYIE